jgi:hypothetical protein
VIPGLPDEGPSTNGGKGTLVTAPLKRLLIEMVDTTFLIEFRTPNLGAQCVLAARAEVRGEHLLLLNSSGQLAAVFMLENVKSWSEVSSELI